MFQLIVFIIFLISAIAVAGMLYRKIPALIELPQNGHHGIKKPEVVAHAENRIKDLYFHFFKKQMLLHKLLSFSKIWILRIENKIDVLLHGVRKKNQEVTKQHRKRKKS